MEMCISRVTSHIFVDSGSKYASLSIFSFKSTFKAKLEPEPTSKNLTAVFKGPSGAVAPSSEKAGEKGEQVPENKGKDCANEPSFGNVEGFGNANGFSGP